MLVAEGTRLRFFHEEYFDFIFARQHIQSGQTAADLVRDDAQDLLRQGQVRAVLALEHQADPPRYLRDLRAVLDRLLVRSHLRAAVLTWLTDHATIEDHELQLVLEIAANDQDPLRGHALRVLSSHPFIARPNRALLVQSTSNLAIAILHRHGYRNIVAALRRNARDATRLLPLLGITSS